MNKRPQAENKIRSEVLWKVLEKVDFEQKNKNKFIRDVQDYASKLVF